MTAYHVLTQTQATEVYEDNQAAIFLAADPKFHGRAKHIDIQYHFSRDAQARKIIKVIKCSTVSIVADSMTKLMSSCIMRTLHIWKQQLIFLCQMSIC